MSELSTLSAAYASRTLSANSTHTFNTTLKAPPANPTTSERTAYLDTLITSIQQLQSDVNAYLTSKMEEDNAAAGKPSIDDAKEEQNYGEEVVEEE